MKPRSLVVPIYAHSASNKAGNGPSLNGVTQVHHASDVIAFLPRRSIARAQSTELQCNDISINGDTGCRPFLQPGGVRATRRCGCSLRLHHSTTRNCAVHCALVAAISLR